MSLVIYDAINKRAERTFGEEVTPENFRFYAAHWLSTAEKFRTECAKNDLNATACAISDIIGEQIRILTPVSS